VSEEPEPASYEDENYCVKCRCTTAPEHLIAGPGGWHCRPCLGADDEACASCGGKPADFVADIGDEGAGMLCAACAAAEKP
jgi:hypothetical protein